MHEATRREVLALLAGGVAAALTGCRSSGPSAAPAHPAAGRPLTQPDELVSANGTLHVTLRAAATQVSYGSSTRYALTYNGTTPGPTLRLRPGDRLLITLENHLDTETNLHTHGLHVSPDGDADNIFVMVAPGESRTYTYDIPADHRSGLFWYHPHVHGLVAAQVSGGLAGMIVLEDGIDAEARLVASTERLLLLADPSIGRDAAVLAVSGMATMSGREGDDTLVNGMLAPDIALQAGTLERWRLVNASASRFHQVAIDGHTMQAIASDGGRLTEPVPVDRLLLAPGERAEVLVAPTSSGTFRVRALAYDRGTAMMGGSGGMGGMGGSGGMMGSGATSVERTLATMTVTDSSAAAPLPDRLAPADALALPPADGTRTLTLAMGAMGGGRGMMSFTIDGRSFDPGRTDISVWADTVEEWTLRNLSPMDHPFHLHVWPFQVVGGPAHLGWMDTVEVPANSEVRIRIPFTGITGRTVYHCHILDHEDLGMMGVINVG